MNLFTISDVTEILRQARSLGFSDVKFIPAIDPGDSFREGYREYLSRKFHASMKYLENIEAKFSVQAIYENTKTIAVFSLPYLTMDCIEEIGKHPYSVSAYAAGHDYRHVAQEKLESLLGEFGPGRIVCDTTPLPERYHARRAGLGFTGKNSMLIHPDHGSYFFLAFILFARPLPDQETKIILDQNSIARDIEKFCGSCRRCMDACPGGALDGSGYLDARKCYSFWSIENRGDSIDHPFKKINSVFGCDICQQVCPYNKQPLLTKEPEFQPGPIAKAVMDGNFENLSLKGTSFQRARIKGLVRNFDYINRQPAGGGLAI